MRGLLFDLDDTLYDRERFVQSGFEAVAAYVAESWRRPRAMASAVLRDAHAGGDRGREFQVLCAAAQLPLSAVPALVHVFRSHAPAIALEPAVHRLLQRLRSDGWRLGIVTNGHPAVQRRKVDALGLATLVDAVIYAEAHSSHGKPDPSVFTLAAERLGVPRSRCVHAGDDPHCDIAGAHAAGLRSIRVMHPPSSPRPTTASDRVEPDTRPDATVRTVLDVPQVAAALFMESPRVA